MTGGEVIVKMLKKEGVEKVFGIIDGTYFGFYHNLKKHGIELISPRHETTAVHMAGAYAKLTGRLGVCIASNGPGAANALPGVAVENGEGSRVLLFTSHRRTGITYPDRGGTYQYFNQVGVMKPMTKWSGSAQTHERIPEITRRALRKSWQGRPGVVHLDVPEDLINSECGEPVFLEPHEYRRTARIEPPQDLVERAAELLAGCKQPIIHAGSGIIHAQAFDGLRRVAEMLRAPVTTSWGARGVLPETSELAVPMIHVELNNRVRNAADVVLTLGSRLGETDWWGKPPYWKRPSEQKMIQVDVDDDYLGCNKPTEIAVLADAGLFLHRLAETLEGHSGRIDTAARNAFIQEIGREREEQRAELDASLQEDTDPMNPAHVAHTCRRVFDDDAVSVFDGGNTAVWGNFYHEMRTPNTQLSTHKLGMLGAGIGQALGAAAAFPDRQVYCIIGDGAMGFHQQEMETAVRKGLKPIFLVLCDRQWGMVKMSQQFAVSQTKPDFGPEDIVWADFSEIKFDKLAESMGAHGERISRAGEIEPAIERCRASGRCSVIHVDVDSVKHMWAPGLMQFKEMHLEPKGE